MKRILLYLLFNFILVTACSNPSDTQMLQINCINLQKGLVYLENQIVNIEINKLTVDLKPKVTQEDQLGHRENLNILIDRINNYCDNMSVELICYACIETNPPQSEILISTDSLGTMVKRVVNLSAPNTEVLRSGGVHAYPWE